MGTALLRGWLEAGIQPGSLRIIEPNPSAWLKESHIELITALPETPPDVCVLAVKPQILPDAVRMVQPLGNADTVILSIAAGITLNFLQGVFGSRTPIVRAMPNTPAAIGHGISALIGNRCADGNVLELAEDLLSVAGETVRLDDESQLDAVTAVSGSGPAYVFHLIETLTAAGIDEGLEPGLALRLAKATVAGAGRLALLSGPSPSQLRVDVTSPAGTTAAALSHLMDEKNGLATLMRRSVKAAADRSRELGKTDG